MGCGKGGSRPRGLPRGPGGIEPPGPHLSFAKMVMGLWPTLHHESQLSSPLRRRLDTSMVCGISSPSPN
jgi:hypothetical protein